MTEQQTIFLAKSEIKSRDLEHKRKLSFNIQKYNDNVVKGKQQFFQPGRCPAEESKKYKVEDNRAFRYLP